MKDTDLRRARSRNVSFGENVLRFRFSGVLLITKSCSTEWDIAKLCAYQPECVLVCISWKARGTFNGNSHLSYHRSKFKWDIFPLCLLATRHFINTLRKDAERFDYFLFHIGGHVGCELSEALEGFLEVVRVRGEAGGRHRFTPTCVHRRRKVTQHLLRIPPNGDSFSRQLLYEASQRARKTAWRPIWSLAPSLPPSPSFHYRPPSSPPLCLCSYQKGTEWFRCAAQNYAVKAKSDLFPFQKVLVIS